MTTLTVAEAQARFVQLLDQLTPGEEILVMQDERPIAKIVGQGATSRPPRRPGSARGKLTILAEDDEHLKDFEEYEG